ncbi:MAG: hypothetical protein ACRCT8_13405 [Lacipirellulaceae bacterium]
MDPTLQELSYRVALAPGEPLALPPEASSVVGPGEWLISIRPTEGDGVTRDHSAFLSGYGPEDEGLYDDVQAG